MVTVGPRDRLSFHDSGIILFPALLNLAAVEKLIGFISSSGRQMELNLVDGSLALYH